MRGAVRLGGLWLVLCVADAPAQEMAHPALPWTEALEQASHPGDFTRILADGPPELWDAAAEGLLGEKERVNGLALPIVLQRLGALRPETRFRVTAALVRDARDPRLLPLLERLAFEPGPLDDPRLQAMAAERRRRGGGASEKAPAEEPPPAAPGAGPAPERGAVATAWLLLGLLVSGGLGLTLFLWGFRLLRLRRLVQGVPPSTARSLAVGQVALQGEAQPLDGESLTHPETGEVCLFYEGAGRDGRAPRFSVVDETGRVTVNLPGALLLSADGVIVPGERVHLIGEALRGRPGPGERAGEVVVGAPGHERSAFQKTVQLMVGSVMGGLFGRGSARMLFTDPLRCFWVWDDLQATPFSRPRETAWMAGAFVLAGAWVVVFVAAATALLDP